MQDILLTLLIGLIIGIIDIAPMIKMKLDRYALLSAFSFYFVMPFIIYNLDFLNNQWWLKGSIITLVLSFPTTILIAKADKKGCIPVVIMSIVLGTIIGVVGYYIGLM